MHVLGSPARELAQHRKHSPYCVAHFRQHLRAGQASPAESTQGAQCMIFASLGE
jgi:hypothetical protein